MEDKMLKLKELANQILEIVNQEEMHEAGESDQMENNEERAEQENMPKKDLIKATLVAKLKKKIPLEE